MHLMYMPALLIYKTIATLLLLVSKDQVKT